MNEPVYLAIPNYNMGKELAVLLPRVLKEDFAFIYVLDDASTDDSVRVVQKYAKTNRVTLISGLHNKGAGSNRNRIIGNIKQGIVVFLDADMELLSSGVVPKIRHAFRDKNTGIVGFEIIENNKPMSWNFGVKKTPKSDIQQLRKILKENNKTFIAKSYANHDPQILSANPSGLHMDRQEVFWVAEGFFAVRAPLFDAIGGFDKAVRYHEAQTLTHRIRATGSHVVFDPCITARHLKVEVRGKAHRRLQKLHADIYVYLKYSHRKYKPVKRTPKPHTP